MAGVPLTITWLDDNSNSVGAPRPTCVCTEEATRPAPLRWPTPTPTATKTTSQPGDLRNFVRAPLFDGIDDDLPVGYHDTRANLPSDYRPVSDIFIRQR
jgi:hypothetical protein